MDRNVKIAKQLIRLAKSLVANDVLSLDDIRENASRVIGEILRKHDNLVDGDSIMGSRDQMTEEEEYEDNGEVGYSVFDTTWESKVNDLLNILVVFRDDGLINVQAYTYGNGTKIGGSHDGLNESQAYSVVDEILKDWRKELPSIYEGK
jgi:hypothetical protein